MAALLPLIMHVLLAVIALLYPVLAPAAGDEDVYHARFTADLSRVNVRACFAGPAPRALFRQGAATSYASPVQSADGPVRVDSDGWRVRLSGLRPDSCVDWEVDISRALGHLDQRTAYRNGSALLADADLWFWRDGERRPIRVDVELSPGLSFSAPWRELPPRGGIRVFRPAATPASWSSRIAIGRFPELRVRVPGTELRVAMIGDLDDDQRRRLTEWIQQSAASVATVSGEFPRSLPQILIIAISGQRNLVPWAHVMRGGGASVEFFVDATRSLDALSRDWTATHELSHLLLPFVTRRDRWLSEGLASYYQNVLRARDGRLTELEAWDKLHSGFERGRRDTRGETLADATRAGRGTTMRVYWSGAAMMMMADTRLRALSRGRQSLDTALAELQGCCSDESRSWRARDLFAKLDELTGFTVFEELYRDHVTNTEFPDLSSTYDRLGLRPQNGKVQLEPDAQWARIRHFIMNDSGALQGASGRPRG